MAKNIVICCDGTGNEIGETMSNVLKLFRILTKTARQRVYYNPGVGTIGQQNAWQRFKQQARGVFGLATGYGLDDDVLSAYRFLCLNYESGDKIYLFGFSRGAYTVRVLAGFVNVIGLLRPDQLNLAPYAFSAYKNSSSRDGSVRPNGDAGDDEQNGAPSVSVDPALAAAWHFSRVASAYSVPIEFIGVWDTVASIIVPRWDRLSLGLQALRYTRTNPRVKIFRQAIAIDERRRMFRLNVWTKRQMFRPNPFDATSEIAQDIREVWFSGVHADVGGGYREVESGLSKFPLLWMIEQAAAAGVIVNRAMVNHLVLGRPRKGSNHVYVPPSATAALHDSMTMAWRLLEYWPKNVRWREWPLRPVFAGLYLPRAEPRPIPDGALIHRSVLERRRLMPDYRPENWNDIHEVEEDSAIDRGAVGADEGDETP
ncbi:MULTISPECIES: DUF2235 domain-containing protein [unclassified Beijerinckia]|uniref:DUF2235 domain-containing protein n=1 Tax=unclassified Beijerinckia TaxID=2638183 RepID=UPI000895D3A6|nr:MULTISPECIES: DUF2235 domain-containing protein [unclassified Beijerinckia]MDH7794063.1 uncharacterized protein (DUF2235 family) [Beijerinckia sp. GAS462]SEB52465.1 Uncharacterized protein, PA2063/DUF2235 family [Beijerinckia sp. 28-YEA-48]